MYPSLSNSHWFPWLQKQLLIKGIFAWIVAYAAEERIRPLQVLQGKQAHRKGVAGKKRITPWWRTVKSNGELNEKYPGGILNQKRLLAREGVRVAHKGKKYVVVLGK